MDLFHLNLICLHLICLIKKCSISKDLIHTNLICLHLICLIKKCSISLDQISVFVFVVLMTCLTINDPKVPPAPREAGRYHHYHHISKTVQRTHYQFSDSLFNHYDRGCGQTSRGAVQILWFDQVGVSISLSAEKKLLCFPH